MFVLYAVLLYILKEKETFQPQKHTKFYCNCSKYPIAICFNLYLLIIVYVAIDGPLETKASARKLLFLAIFVVVELLLIYASRL